jgi:hypothetical protein
VWELPAGKKLYTLPRTSAARFSPDGRFVIGGLHG